MATCFFAIVTFRVFQLRDMHRRNGNVSYAAPTKRVQVRFLAWCRTTCPSGPYCFKIGSHEIAASEGAEEVGGKVTWSMSREPGHGAFPTNPKPEKNGL